MSTRCALFVFLAGLVATSLSAAEPTAADVRAKAQKDQSAGNFREAWESFRKLALDPEDAERSVPGDFNSALQCLKQLGREEEIDAFRERVITLHAKNWRLLQAAADSDIGDTHYGYLIGGAFSRGNHRGGGESVSSQERDRVRALQLMHQAIPLLKAEPDDAVGSFFIDLAGQLQYSRGWNDAWELQALTDLSKLPDYEPAGRSGRIGFGPRETSGAPVDADGNPVFHHLPSGFETAKTDGERWRWALAQAAKFSPSRKDDIALAFADFLHEQFGVQTLRSFGWRLPIGDDGRLDESAPLAVQTLKEDETLARLATGVKRFTLADEFNYLRIYREVASSGNRPQAERAIVSLAGIFENRRQYPRAAEVWRECIRRFGSGTKDERQRRLDQIVGNWGRFEPASTQPALPGRVVGFRFRNGSRLDVEAHEIRVDKLLADVKEYLKSQPSRLEWNRVNVGDIGYRLVEENQAQYVGERVAAWTVRLEPRPGHFDRLIDVATPLQKAGAYLVTAKMADGNTSRIVLWLADTAIVRKSLANASLYFVADAVTGRPIGGANLEFFGYKQDNVKNEEVGRNEFRLRTSNFAELTDSDGQAFPDPKDLQSEFQWIVIARTQERRLAYLGFEGIWYRPTAELVSIENKAFAISDRPIYRPGQKVNFKFWLRRASYGGPEGTPFAGQAFKVRVTDQTGVTVFEKTYTADTYGGFDGHFALAQDAALGVYSVSIVERNDISGGESFRVEEYKKPEYEVTIGLPAAPVALGEKIAATMKADYYFGGPVTRAKAHYKVTRTSETARWYPFGIWDWCYGPGYWWFWSDYTWYPGWKIWGCARPIAIWWPVRFEPPEVVLDATAPIGADGTLKIEIDTALAKAVHGNSDHRYEITAEVVDASRRTVVGTGHVMVARKPFEVFAWTDRGYHRVGDVIKATFHAQTLDHKPVRGKGVATLYHVTYSADGKPSETAVQSWNFDPNDAGTATLDFQAPQSGQFRLSYKLTDAKSRTIEGAVVLTVLGRPFVNEQFRFNELELVPEKREYAPGETVRLLINTNRAGSTVVLFVRPAEGVYPKPQVLRLAAKSTMVNVAVAQKDMPNFFVEAFTIADGRVYSETREIVVPPVKRVMNVAVVPSADRYKPGAKASVQLKLTDQAGKPITGSAVLAVYDKAVDAIAGGTNIAEIREYFWKWRRHHYPQTESSLARLSWNLLKQGEIAMGGVGIFGELVDESTDDKAAAPPPGAGAGRAAPSAAPMSFGMKARAAAPLMAKGAAPEVQPTVRTQFADTAFWAAHIEANSEGKAEVFFSMPENLTTWKIRAWTMGAGTRVGQGESDVITSKNLLVRMQAPRFFVEKDEVVLSANVHNRLESSKSVRVVLELEGPTLTSSDAKSKTVEIPSGGETRVDWRVKAVEHGEAIVRMLALTHEESDAVETHFPVRVHGLLRTESYTGSIRPERESGTFNINVPAQRRINDTHLEIRYSPTVAGAMVDALPYLVFYPHDTTDCTLNRFLPTVITQNILKRMNLDLNAIRNKRTNLNSQEAGDAAGRATGWKQFEENPVFDNAKVARMVKDGVKALAEMQLGDGGWGWFSGWHEHSEPQMTAQVVHGLQLARKNGVALVPDMLDKGVDWLKQYQTDQIRRLQTPSADDPKRKQKVHADNTDAVVYLVLVESGHNGREMQDFLFRDRTELSVYGKGLFGLALSAVKADERLADIVKNIDQFLVQDAENQTAYLKLPEGSFWWFWYDGETEANAAYLKLLSRIEPKGEKASRLAKYLLNNRKHSTYWSSPRDTAAAIEALAEYVVASGEDRPELTVEVLLDGKKIKKVKINAENLFTFDNKVDVGGDALGSGPHKIELRKRGKGRLYFNAELTTFTLEDFIKRAGLEIRVARKYFKLVRNDKTTHAAGSRGQVVDERTEKYRRIELAEGATLQSGDLVEVELTIDSKNDYEQVVFDDPKAAGIEPFDILSGYVSEGLPAYAQLRDEKVTFFVRWLARGKHSLRYRIRAEIPGKFSALPTAGYAMYAPELKGNSDETNVSIKD